MKLKSLFLGALAALVSMAAFADTQTGSFTVTLSGCSATFGSTTASYVKDTSTGLVFLTLPNIHCTSNATTANLSGLPTEILPASQMTQAITVRSGGNLLPGQARMVTGVDNIGLSVYDGTLIVSTGFVASGDKGFPTPGTTLIYFSAPVL